MQYNPTVEKIISILSSHNYWFETFEHEPVRTSKEAVKTRPGYTLKQGAKAMIIRVKIPNVGKKFLMLVIPADRKFDSNRVEQVLNVKDTRFATEQEVTSITSGIAPGGVPPFGNLFGLDVVVDVSLFLNEKIVFNAGDRRFSIAMKSQDYKKIANPQIVTIT